MFSKLIIVGNLGRDPEMRYTPNGNPVTSFSVATSHNRKDSNGQKITETTWFKVTAWGKLAEICNQYLVKGKTVIVEGRLTPDENGNPRVWTGRDGEAKASYEVTAADVRFVSGGAGAGVEEAAEEEEEDAIIPF